MRIINNKNNYDGRAVFGRKLGLFCFCMLANAFVSVASYAQDKPQQQVSNSGKETMSSVGLGQVDKRIIQPAPPGNPTQATLNTKATTRFWGNDPYSVAVSLTQHMWPAAFPADDPPNAVTDRPWGVVLVGTEDKLQAISAIPLIHFPMNAPILYADPDGIPQITMDEIKRLGPVGIARTTNVKGVDKPLEIILVGDVATDAVRKQLDSAGLNHTSITGEDLYELTNNIDRFYGQVQYGDLGVPVMGNGAANVFVANVNAWEFMLPITHWASHVPSAELWVDDNGIPEGTRKALERRNGDARIYVMGGADQISTETVKELSQYGKVIRITANNVITHNAPIENTPMNVSLQFSEMWDGSGQVGWNILSSGHGFTIGNIDDWTGIVASAPLSHMGFHAPLILTDSADKMPDAVTNYLKKTSAKFTNTPAEGPYNMIYIIGNFDRISWKQQNTAEALTNISPIREWDQQF